MTVDHPPQLLPLDPFSAVWGSQSQTQLHNNKRNVAQEKSFYWVNTRRDRG